jgi:hypothetical protein
MLDKHFKCPKSLKIMLIGQSKSQRRGMLEAHASMLALKRRQSIQRGSADKE